MSGIRGIRNDLLKAVAAAKARKIAADTAATEALREQAAAQRALTDAWEALDAHVGEIVEAVGVEGFDTAAFKPTPSDSPQSDEEGGYRVTAEQIDEAARAVEAGPRLSRLQEDAIATLNDEYGVKTWGWVGGDDERLDLIVTLDDGRRMLVAEDGVASPVHDIR